MQLDCLIYGVLTVAIPVKLTLAALKENKNEEKMSLWAHYWAFFFLLKTL